MFPVLRIPSELSEAWDFYGKECWLIPVMLYSGRILRLCVDKPHKDK